MQYPQLKEESVSPQTIQTFLGYNHNLKISEGEFYETKNLTSQYYPMMANRNKRSTYLTGLTKGQGMIEKDALAYIDNGHLYYNQADTGVEVGTDDKERQIVSMGAYILVWPDKVYYNTQDPSDKGSIEADYSSFTASEESETQYQITYEMCDSSGKLYENVISSDSEPENPSNGQNWIDTANMEFKQYSSSQKMWVSFDSVYVKVSFQGDDITAKFSEYDGVTISGLSYNEDLNGDKIIYAIGGSEGTYYIVLIGINKLASYSEVGQIHIERSVPDMDYVCECQNRLWGCFYGNDGLQNVNEIYCCALGDFKNWNQFLGVSTDSYAASVGSDGVWTGAINYLGYPTFFKENTIHRVNVSSTGAHQITETPARGVQKGSHKSLAIIAETLYYKSRTDICAYQGSYPESVSSALGDELYYKAVAGAFGSRYFISMQDKAGDWQLFCYDTKYGTWMHEDNLHATCFARVDDSLYCMTGTEILDLNGVNGTKEGTVAWEATTGMMHYQYTSSRYTYADPEKKCVSRYDLRIKMERGAVLEMFIEYDSSGEWEPAGRIQFHGTNSVLLPVRPHRCDHLRLKLRGKGEVRLFSLTRNLVRGSDA